MHINDYDLSMAMNDVSDVNRKVERLEKRVETLERILAAHPERTAKVENQYCDYLPYARFMEDELRGSCENCGETVWIGEKFCHECGARLEWK